MSGADLFSDAHSIDYPIIDSDAHVQEPPDLWQSRAPAKWKARAPRVEQTEHGDFWLFDDGEVKQWVAIGWIDLRPAVPSDSEKYPMVIRGERP